MRLQGNLIDTANDELVDQVVRDGGVRDSSFRSDASDEFSDQAAQLATSPGAPLMLPAISPSTLDRSLAGEEDDGQQEQLGARLAQVEQALRALGQPPSQSAVVCAVCGPSLTDSLC